ncbi:MAG: hypothetical protein RBR43_07665 [Desulfuromonadaceae bacterium]|nr:hypothetical protein [Desulfuromonadaceae bacterium]
MRHVKLGLLVTGLLLTFALQGFAAEWYVSQEAGKNKNAGDSPATAFKNIQKALDQAAPGDTVKVAQGNYFGTMKSGNIIMKKPVTLLGGFSPDFTQRNVLQYQTRIQPDNNSNGTGCDHPLLRIDVKLGEIVIDGFLFDKGESNNYHLQKGIVEGVEEGLLIHPPQVAKQGMRPNAKMPLIAGPGAGGFDGNLLIQNCLFLNGNNCAVRFQVGGNVKILNNVFVANVMSAMELWGGNRSERAQLEFAHNTVLFTWSRTSEMGDMGYGVRVMTMMDYNIHHNIIGFSSFAGVDATRDDKDRKLSMDYNVFLLNKQADLTLPGGGLFMRVWVEDFEDLEIESSDGNTAPKDLSVLAGAVNKAYAGGFLSATYKETVDYDENSPMNQFRVALGLNKQGTISSTVSMYANKYPFDDAIKLFGAVSDVGAQLP